MKKQVLNLTKLIIIAFISLYAIKSYAQNASLTINFGVPQVDGDTTDWEGFEWQPFLYPNVGGWTDDDLTPYFKMSWDRNKVYMLFKVIDNTINTENGSPWMRDGMEIAAVFEPLSNYKIIVWCGATVNDLTSESHSGVDNDNEEGFEIASDTIDNGYIIELGIPYNVFIYSASSFLPFDGNKFRFEVWVNDSDNGTDRKRTSWANCSNINNSPGEYDPIVLSAVTKPKKIEVDYAAREIDGSFSEWTDIPENLVQNPVYGKVTSLQDLSGIMKANWDTANLYLHIAAFDSSETFHAEDSLDWNNRDAVHIALNLEGDTTYNINTTDDDDEALIVIPYNATQNDIESFSKKVDSWTGFEYAIDTTYSYFDEEAFIFFKGYAIECKIPFKNIWPDFVADSSITFDMEHKHC